MAGKGTPCRWQPPRRPQYRRQEMLSGVLVLVAWKRQGRHQMRKMKCSLRCNPIQRSMEWK
jgi:hypothetical protein